MGVTFSQYGRHICIRSIQSSYVSRSAIPPWGKIDEVIYLLEAKIAWLQPKVTEELLA